ncbi:MAG: DUF3253 domain-containing protein [Bdellovibrionia bacterium]
MNKETKICSSCGRSFEKRKKWEKNWEQIKYCSDECRRNKDRFDFQKDIIQLLQKRSPSSSICPSEILPAEEKQNKTMMEHVRRSARLLAHQGVIEITQQGKAVNPDDFRGPIRLRLK